MKRIDRVRLLLALAIVAASAAGAMVQVASRVFAQQATLPSQQAASQVPSYPLKFGAFTARFDPGGTFTLQGQGWPN
jgi:hypothetical protein